MIDNLINLVQQFSGDAVTNNPDIPKDKNNAVIQSVTDGIFKGLQNQASEGGLNQILGLFSSSGDNSGIIGSLSKSIQTTVVSSLMDKVGIKNDIAKGIAVQLVPSVLGALSKNAADPKNSGFNVNTILSSITGGKTKGIDVQNLLDKFAGGDDGKFDLGDVMNLLGKGKSNSSEGNSDGGGGLLGALGGLLGGKK